MERMDPGGAVGPRVTTVTGLRRGAGPDGRVTDGALARLGACLDDYAGRIARAGSPPVTAVGTAAVREAPNRGDIESLVGTRLGVPLRVIGGEEEAALSFAGARLALTDGTAACTVIDIGGGSTEVVEGDAAGPRRSVSLPLGVNRQGDMITTDPPRKAEVEAIVREAREMVARATAGFTGDGPLLGVAGTVTTLAAVMIGHYDPAAVHRTRIGRDEVQEVLARMASMAAGERARTPGVHPDRVNVIVPGLAILLGALTALGADGLMASECDLLDGIALAVAAGRGVRAE